jgi:cytidylate kinase
VTLVTISATYGAGGSRIAPRLAERLGVPLLGRPPVPGLAENDACEGGVRAGQGLLARAASLAASWGTPPGMTVDDLLPDRERRRELEEEVCAFAAGGGGVILGRGAVVVLRDDPRALHVFLDGPADARVAQAMEIEGIDEATARRRLARTDRFRRAYVEDLYGVDVREPGVVHLTLDSTALGVDACVEVIATASLHR